MNRKLKKYGVYKEKVCIFKGTKEEIASRFGIKPNSVYDYATSSKLMFRRYRIKRIADGKDEEVQEEKPVSQNKKNIDHLLMFLKMHGNVASDFDPSPYLPDLYDNGFDCRVREIVEKRKSKVSGRHRKDDVWYVTECVRMVNEK